VRNAFIETLCQVAEEKDSIWLLTGDLGYSVLEPFVEKFSDRYINAGIAEQNMTGMAAGLALSGKIALTYSIANFPTLRCLEQIRNDICYHRANVKIVSVGGGYSYGNLGYTHHGIEDLSIMRSLPNLTVVAPGDPVESRLLTRAILNHDGPCYLRLGKAGEPVVHQKEVPVTLGKAICVREGQDVTLVSTGGMLKSATQVADQLSAKGIQARVLSMHTLKPIDTESIVQAAKDTGGIATMEENSVIGGLGSGVLEALQESGVTCKKFLRFGISSRIIEKTGSQDYLRNEMGLSVEKMTHQIMQSL